MYQYFSPNKNNFKAKKYCYKKQNNYQKCNFKDNFKHAFNQLKKVAAVAF